MRSIVQVCRTVLASFALASVASTVVAQSPADTPPRGENAGQSSARDGAFLLHGVAPASERSSPGVAFGYGGYDGANDAGLMEAIGDMNVIGPLDVRLGVAYAPDAEEGEHENSAQPHVGARLHVLTQKRQGIDAAFQVAYRMDRFTDEEGLVSGTLAFGRRWDRLGTFANVGYAQDVEGDDREGELFLAVLFETASAVQLGLESRLRWDLFSADPKHEERESNLLDFTAGPCVQWTLGPIALLAQAGVHTTRGDDGLDTGAIALSGLGYAY